jgi:hypothetical protein
MPRRLLPAILFLLAFDRAVGDAQPVGESLEALPLMERPAIAVDAVGLRQAGRHLELAGLLTNTDPNTVRVLVTLNPSNQNAAFTASIVMWFAPPADQTLDAACYGLASS